MSDDEIADLVFLCEDPVPADLVMVFAAANERDMERRTRRGVDLYRAGYVPKLLVTGGGVLARACPEARRMAQIAHDLGVPKSDLLIEDRSSNTFENARFSLSVIRAAELLDKLSTVILVSSEWHMRRVLYTTWKYFPESIRMVCCPSCEGCNRDNWTQSETCRKEVANEALLLATFLESGALSKPNY
jgi:vancomycin permeability regulator SanA